MGFPIRKCPDQSLFAAPRTLSQRTTSFIASQRQGIHRIPLRHLIVLINNARRSAAAPPQPSSRTTRDKTALSQKDQFCLPNAPGIIAVRHEAQRTDQTSRHGLHADPRDGESGPNTFLSTMTANPRIPANQDRKLRTCLQHWRSDGMNRRPQLRGKHDSTRHICAMALQLDPRSNWWSQTGSNRRPHACKARALPTELWPARRAAHSCAIAKAADAAAGA